MSQIGDVAETHQKAIVVKAPHEDTGNNKTGHFKLLDNPDIAHYIANYASVRISGPIVLEISGPVSSTLATTSVAAIYPDKYPDSPSTKNQVRRLEGSVTLQHSLVMGAVTANCTPGRQVADILSPKTLIDFPPVVAYHVDIAGGTNTSAFVLIAHVPLVLDGVAHRKTW